MRKIGTEAENIKKAIFDGDYLYDSYPKGTCKELGFESVDTTPLTEYFKIINSLRINKIATKDEFEKYMEIYNYFDGIETVDVVAIPISHTYELP